MNISMKSHCQIEKSGKDITNPIKNLYHLESAMHKIKPNIFKLLKHMNKDMKE